MKPRSDRRPDNPTYRECLCGASLDNPQAKHPQWCGKREKQKVKK